MRRVRMLSRLFGLNAMAIVSFLLLTLSPIPWLGFVTSALTLGAAWWRNRKSGMGKAVSVRILLVGGLIAQYLPNLQDTNDYSLLATTAMLVMLMMHEGLVQRVVSKARLQFGQLPNFATRTDVHVAPQYVFHANTLMIVLLGVFAVPEFPSWPLVVAAGLLSAGVAALLFDARALLRGNGRAWARFSEALQEYEPTFAVYFSGPPGMVYQVSMWLPYLDRLGKPYVVVLREGAVFNHMLQLTDQPVVVCNTIGNLDQVAVDGLHACFYVNNGMKNSHFVKFRDITHIQLLHGDSDKPPSYNAVTGMYDRVFVAGQAGIDRYHKHGVNIPESKFEIVGRPQVEDIDVTRTHIGDRSNKAVLYAPTWVGFSDTVNYCSLPVAHIFVQKLIERDVTVILRSHPYTGRDSQSLQTLHELEHLLAQDRQRSGRKHVFGSAATEELTIVECFNAADAMISDVSSVVSDFLFSEKPFAITDMVDEQDEFVESFPLARAAYVLRKDMSNADDVLDQLLKTDPLEQTRKEARAYYLGDYPAETYVDAFVAGANKYI
ncbi:MAG: CDP-glycerol glycerophosphotransferase [Streptosporangiales bacterium]|nr:CDP-glycerol glycerophosphotransferase [Streptosporangiales bacterium]